LNEELKIIISAEVKKLKDSVQSAKDEIISFKEQVKKAGEDVDGHMAAAGEGIKKGMAIGATAIAATATALLGLAASTAEYRNAQAQLVTAFEAAGGSADVAKSAYNDLYRVLGDGGQATEAAQHLAKLTTNEKELSEWTNICQGVYATFGASLPIEGLTEAANETAKVGTVTGSLADALNWAGISEDAFNEKLAACNTEAEREKLIRETLNGIYDDAAAKYEKNNADVLAQNEAQANLDATMASLGETLAPVITALTTLATDVLATLTPYIQQFAENYLPVIQDILGVVAEKLGSALAFLLEHQTVLGVIAGVIATVVTAIGLYNAVAAVKAAMDAAQVTTLGALIAAQLASAAATIVAMAPYIAIAAAIAALIAIIVLCVKNWDTIKETIVKVANAVKEKVLDMVEKVKGFFTSMKENLTNKVEEIRTKITNTFNKVKDAITKPVEKARDAVKNVVDKIKGFFNFTWSLPKLKVPKFGITPQGWKVGDLLEGKIPKLSVQWNARGGVFDSPTLFGYNGSLQGIGEAGAEAVVPLENNLEWLDKLASMLDARLASRQPTVLMVDKRVLGQASAEGINEITKQTGNMPLVIA
jgi:phage-related protein